MNETLIRSRLISYGERHIESGPELVNFTQNTEANKLINDLKNFPHAFVLACIMDRQIKAEKAWLIPFRIQERMKKKFTMDVLAKLSEEEITNMMSEPSPLHRFTKTMSKYFYLGVQRISKQYANDASKIWQGKPASSELVHRFLEFDGVGPKIASMASNILVRFFKIELSEYSSIDISADVHVLRVFGRLGLCRVNPSIEEVIYKARTLNPQFPGLLDISCWHIGRSWCKPKLPDCVNCFMDDVCPKVDTD